MPQLLLNLLMIIGILLIWQMGAALGLGLLRLWKIRLGDWLERQLVTTALGWTMLGFFFYGLALLGLFYHTILILVSLLLALLVMREKPWQGFSVSTIRHNLQTLPLLGKICLAIGSLFVLINLAGALAPDTGFDSTWYHLPYAQEFIREHVLRIHPVSMQDVAAFVPKFAELLFSWPMSFTPLAPTVPQLMQWLSGLFLAAATYALARRLVGKEWSLLAALLVYSLNVITWLSALAYIDLLTAFLGLSITIAIVNWAEQRQANQYPWLVGLLLGGFLFAKLQSFFFLPVVSLAVWSIRRRMGDILLAVGGGLLLALPWYFQVWRRTGALLGNAVWPPGDVHLGGANTLMDWFIRVHPLTFLTTTTELLRRETPFVFLLLPALFIWRRLPPYGRVILVSALLLLFFWTYIPVHEVRYGLVIFPFVAAIVVWYFARAPRFLQRTALLCLLGVTLLNLMVALNYNQRAFAVALGRQSADRYLGSVLKDNAWIFYDHDGEIAKAVGQGTALALVHNPSYIDVAYVDAIRYKAESYQTLETADEVLNNWRTQGITHLLVHRPYELPMFFENTALPTNEQTKIQKRLKLRYQDENQTRLWEIE